MQTVNFFRCLPFCIVRAKRGMMRNFKIRGGNLCEEDQMLANLVSKSDFWYMAVQILSTIMVRTDLKVCGVPRTPGRWDQGKIFCRKLKISSFKTHPVCRLVLFHCFYPCSLRSGTNNQNINVQTLGQDRTSFCPNRPKIGYQVGFVYMKSIKPVPSYSTFITAATLMYALYRCHSLA